KEDDGHPESLDERLRPRQVLLPAPLVEPMEEEHAPAAPLAAGGREDAIRKVAVLLDALIAIQQALQGLRLQPPHPPRARPPPTPSPTPPGWNRRGCNTSPATRTPEALPSWNASASLRNVPTKLMKPLPGGYSHPVVPTCRVICHDRPCHGAHRHRLVTRSG